VLIANIIAWPITFYAVNKWLQNFAYHIEMNYWLFFIGGFIALLIALTTVSYQAIRAATANPVDSLKNE
jgi:putative ABC transport system permease protein